MGEVKFVGPGPFALPVAQYAKAIAAGNTVVASFEVLSDPNVSPQHVETITIQMLPIQANELAAYLVEAVSKALAWERNPPRS